MSSETNSSQSLATALRKMGSDYDGPLVHHYTGPANASTAASTRHHSEQSVYDLELEAEINNEKYHAAQPHANNTGTNPSGQPPPSLCNMFSHLERGYDSSEMVHASSETASPKQPPQREAWETTALGGSTSEL
eukprot:Selendium_serpulae@DN5283_c0_g1_i3.p1